MVKAKIIRNLRKMKYMKLLVTILSKNDEEADDDVIQRISAQEIQ